MYLNNKLIFIFILILQSVTAWAQRDLRPPGIYESGDTTIEIYTLKEQNAIREFKIINGTDIILYREFYRLTKKLKEEGMFKGGYSSGNWKFYGWTGRLKEEINYDNKVKTFYEKRMDITSVAFDFEKYKADSIFAEKYWRMKKEAASNVNHHKKTDLPAENASATVQPKAVPDAPIAKATANEKTNTSEQNKTAAKNKDSVKAETGFLKKMISARKSRQSSGYVPPKVAPVETEQAKASTSTVKAVETNEKSTKPVSPEKDRMKAEKNSGKAAKKNATEQVDVKEIKKDNSNPQPAKKKEQSKPESEKKVPAKSKIAEKQDALPNKTEKAKADPQQQTAIKKPAKKSSAPAEEKKQVSGSKEVVKNKSTEEPEKKLIRKQQPAKTEPEIKTNQPVVKEMKKPVAGKSQTSHTKNEKHTEKKDAAASNGNTFKEKQVSDSSATSGNNKASATGKKIDQAAADSLSIKSKVTIQPDSAVKTKEAPVNHK